MKAFRVFSLPLLHHGDRLTNSISVWFVIVLLGVVGWSVGSGWMKTLSSVLSLGSFPIFGFWFSARLQRERGRRDLAEQTCAVCGTRVGKEASLMAFANYTRTCLNFLEESRDAFSIEPAFPLELACQQCSSELFYDYLGSGQLSVFVKDADSHG